jgi:FkbM family methyltransferase
MKISLKLRHLIDRLKIVVWVMRDFYSVNLFDSRLDALAKLIRSSHAVIRKRETYWMNRPLKYEHRFEPILMSIHQKLVDRCITDILKDDPSLASNFSVLDIGANIGQFSFGLKSRLPSSKIVSLEPNHVIFPLLKENSLQFENWNAINVGVHDSSKGTSELTFVCGRSGQGSIHSSNASVNLLHIGSELSSKKIEVEMFGPERVSSEFGGQLWTLIKIDVEGSEIDVLHAVQGLNFKYLLLETGGPESRIGRIETTSAEYLLNEELNFRVRLRNCYSENSSDSNELSNSLFMNLSTSSELST